MRHQRELALQIAAAALKCRTFRHWTTLDLSRAENGINDPDAFKLFLEPVTWPTQTKEVANVAMEEVLASSQTFVGVRIGRLKVRFGTLAEVMVGPMWIAGLGAETNFGEDLVQTVVQSGRVCDLSV